MDERTFPEAVPDISHIASALADPSRAAMCAALMGGRAWTVRELATYCGIARSTATEHVSTLAEHALVIDLRQGRHRYVRLAGEEIARVIEGMGVVAQSTLKTPGSLRAYTMTERARDGRTCYKHLAGRLGVALADQLQRNGHVSEDWDPTPSGRDLFGSWGIEHAQAMKTATCLDSTERRFHLAGPLGRALCDAFFARGWVERIHETRAVKLTTVGTTSLRESGLQLTTAVDQEKWLVS